MKLIIFILIYFVVNYNILANNCPLKNMDAVHRSRAIVRLYNDSVQYDDITICENVGLVNKSAKGITPKANTEISCSLHPNPTKDKAYLTFTSIPMEPVKMRLSDLQGKVVFETSVELNTNVFEIQTNNLPNAVYTLQVFIGKKEIYQAKLEVIK